MLVNTSQSRAYQGYQGKRAISHIGPLTKAIPHKLFLDMGPSFFEGVTRVNR